MAYEFKPYRSVYRDPQSVKVSEVLRNRYVDNFASDSMLDKAATYYEEMVDNAVEGLTSFYRNPPKVGLKCTTLGSTSRYVFNLCRQSCNLTECRVTGIAVLP